MKKRERKEDIRKKLLGSMSDEKQTEYSFSKKIAGIYNKEYSTEEKEKWSAPKMIDEFHLHKI